MPFIFSRLASTFIPHPFAEWPLAHQCAPLFAWTCMFYCKYACVCVGVENEYSCQHIQVHIRTQTHA